MARPFLTVLTTPVLPARARAYRRVRALLRRLVKPGVPLPAVSPYPGHYAVTRSVVEGLRAIHADFNFNPARRCDVARVVFAPANEALRQAAEWKREGSIDYLVAGPVNALLPEECDGILLMPEIDRVIIAHEWVRSLYAEAPALSEKSRVCPAGVDAEWWKPMGAERTSHALVYWKGGDEALCEQVEHVARTCGLEPRRLRSVLGEHGTFRREDYRQLLDDSVVAIFLSPSETQGLALAEAWSMDVPTVVWDPRGQAEWRGRTYRSGSSAPYLTPATGRSWQRIEELEPVLRQVLAERAAFAPRNWVLAHMTDAVCAATLYALIQEGAAQRTA